MGQSWDVCVIGAGAAGLMAGIYAARGGARTVIVEASTTAGRKLLVTGRGRCNITHDCTVEEFLRACRPYDRFLRHSIHSFGPGKVLEFFHGRGLATKIEPDGCIFPESDRAGDVKRILLDYANETDVQFAYGRTVHQIRRSENGFEIVTDKETLSSRCVILAAGGMSWPQTGTPRNGYELVRHLGHTIIAPRAALIPLVTREDWPRQLQGVGIPDTIISARVGGKTIMERGPLMFTEDGIGGPGVLNLSRRITDELDGNLGVEVKVDLLPETATEVFEQRLIEQAAKHPKKAATTVLAEYFPKAMAGRLCELAGMGTEQTIGQLSKPIRKDLVRQVKELPLTIVTTRPIEEAIVTRGGVDLREIDSKTMASKICPGLYFAGEVMNVDGPCGGYNLTIAFATGALAGMSILTQSRKDAKTT